MQMPHAMPQREQLPPHDDARPQADVSKQVITRKLPTISTNRVKSPTLSPLQRACEAPMSENSVEGKPKRKYWRGEGPFTGDSGSRPDQTRAQHSTAQQTPHVNATQQIQNYSSLASRLAFHLLFPARVSKCGATAVTSCMVLSIAALVLFRYVSTICRDQKDKKTTSE